MNQNSDETQTKIINAHRQNLRNYLRKQTIVEKNGWGFVERTLWTMRKTF